MYVFGLFRGQSGSQSYTVSGQSVNERSRNHDKNQESVGMFGCCGRWLCRVGRGPWLTDHTELAISVIAFMVALASFAIGNVWAAMLMGKGADLTIRSQESDDQRDIAQIKAATDLVKVLMRKEEQAQRQQPTLPMPQQQNWLPPLNEFSDGEYHELGRGDEQ